MQLIIHYCAVVCGRVAGNAATCETNWRLRFVMEMPGLHCKDVMRCEVTRYANGSEGEGQSERVRDRAARLVFGVDLIARHYCGILLDAGHLGQPAHQSNSSAQHSSARQEHHAADLDKEKHQSAESQMVGSFLANLRCGHSQLLPNTPHGTRSTQVHVHVALLPAWCTHAPCSVLYTFNANKSDEGRKKTAKKFPLAGRAVGLAAHLGTCHST